MRFSSWFLPSSATLATFALFASTASAHIELIDPPARYQLPANKSCPCGDGDSNRVCQTAAADTHDDNRGSVVTTLEAGSTITVTASEYIDHAGRMRVAFDDDGADAEDFNANILHDESDPADPSIMQAPRVWNFQVKVPETPCDNCTLQVTQVMNVDTETPVLDPSTDSTYYTCADIRIVPAGTLGDAGSQSGAGGSAVASNAGAAGAAGGGSDDEGGSGSSAGGTRAAGGSTSAGGTASSSAGRAGSSNSNGTAGSGTAGSSVSDSGDDSDDGGCSLGAVGARAEFGWALAPLAALISLELRRRRRAAR